jgi:hypothetical protein
MRSARTSSREGADYVDAADPRQSEVEDDDVRLVSGRESTGVLPRRCDVHVIGADRTGSDADRRRASEFHSQQV